MELLPILKDQIKDDLKEFNNSKDYRIDKL